jgi:hypothetical protein
MKIGDRVLWIDDMSVAWTVTGFKGQIVTAEYREPWLVENRAPAKAELPVWKWVPCPPGWRDCPLEPDPWNHLTHMMRTDAAFYEEVDEWVGQMVVWEMDHVRPLMLRLQEHGK